MTEQQQQQEETKRIGSFGSFGSKRQGLAPQPIRLPAVQQVDPPDAEHLEPGEPVGQNTSGLNASSLDASGLAVQQVDPLTSQTLNASSLDANPPTGQQVEPPVVQMLNASGLAVQHVSPLEDQMLRVGGSNASSLVGQNTGEPDVSGLNASSPKRQHTKVPARRTASVSVGQGVGELKVGELKVGGSKHQLSKRLGIERIQKTMWLPVGLAKWLDHQAVDEEREISEIGSEALQMYRDLWESRR